MNNRSPEMTAETALWAAVLERAIKDVEMLTKAVQKKPEAGKDPLFKSDVRGLYRYFRSKTMEPGGFIFICLHLGQNPSYALDKIEALYLAPLARAIEQSRLEGGSTDGSIRR